MLCAPTRRHGSLIVFLLVRRGPELIVLSIHMLVLTPFWGCCKIELPQQSSQSSKSSEHIRASLRTHLCQQHPGDKADCQSSQSDAEPRMPGKLGMIDTLQS